MSHSCYNSAKCRLTLNALLRYVVFIFYIFLCNDFKQINDLDDGNILEKSGIYLAGPDRREMESIVLHLERENR